MSKREPAKALQSGTSDPGSILVRHLQGDADSFAELIQLYRKRVYSYLVRSGVGERDRDDLFQEIFLTVHRYAGRYNSELPFNPWFFTIVVNTTRSYFRSAKAKRELYQEELPELSDTEPTPIEKLQGKELAGWLERELRELPEDQREAVVLCYIKDMDQEEAAHSLGINLNTLKTNLRRARIHLVDRYSKLRARESRRSNS